MRDHRCVDFDGLPPHERCHDCGRWRTPAEARVQHRLDRFAHDYAPDLPREEVEATAAYAWARLSFALRELGNELLEPASRWIARWKR